MTEKQEQVKKLLNSYLDLWYDIEIKSEEIEKLRSKSEKVTAVLSSAPRGGGKQDFGVTVDRIIALQDIIAEKVQQALEQRQYIERIISQVKSPLHRRVLQRKYINDDTFEQIAVNENKAYKYIAYVIHPQALEMINLGNDVTKKGVM